jgi:hypothetical protein
MKKILKVVSQGEAYDVTKKDGGTIKKCTLVLQEVGGQYENTFAVNLLGNLAGCKFYKDELVYAVLYFTVHEYNGNMYQEISARDVLKIKN